MSGRRPAFLPGFTLNVWITLAANINAVFVHYSYAGLHCKTILGYVKGATFRPGTRFDGTYIVIFIPYEEIVFHIS